MSLFDDPPDDVPRVPPPPDDDTPLGVARTWVRANRDVGVHCPCCDQFAKEYARKLPAVSAMVMIKMYRRNEGRDYVNIPAMFSTMTGLHGGTGDGTKGQWWGLMEPQPSERDDGSWRTGWWRLTDLGREFVVGELKVRRYAHLYNQQVLGMSGEFWSIRDALGKRFNYDELMKGVA